jgi:crossover junction endonuclease MUS81
MLDIGDVHILSSNSNIPVLIIERKSLPDLAASIKDGRYREQKARLLNFRKSTGCALLYLFEGIQDTYSNILSKETLRGCCINSMIRDDIHVHQTTSITDTCEFIEHIMKNAPGWDTVTSISAGSYAKSVKTKKKEFMTPEVCYILQLSQIPGISKAIAEAVKEEHSSISELLQAFSENGDRALENLEIHGKKLGHTRSKRIYNYLHGIGECPAPPTGASL